MLEAAGEDVDVLEALVGGVGRPGQQRHVGSRCIDDRLKDVVGQVRREEDAVVVQVEGVPGEAGGGAWLAMMRPPERAVIPETVPLLG